MSFMIFRRKKFRFLVSFEVEDLSLTPFVNGILFVKIRLANGGTFEDLTTREEVCNNRVQWNKKSQFECRIYANSSTGELETCTLRVSLRKEFKGGKTYQKLGFADINLSEYAGSGQTSRRYLLEGYNSKTRLDNSMIKVNVSMKLLGGDPVFKVPQPKTVSLLGQEPQDTDLHPENKGAPVSASEESVHSDSSGFDSLTRSKHTTDSQNKVNHASAIELHTIPSISMPEKPNFEALASHSLINTSPSATFQDNGHNRNHSSTSEMSKVSGYHSLGGPATGHSRNSSCDNTRILQHKRSCSADAADSVRVSLPFSGSRKKIDAASSIEQRLGSTRVDADTVIENLLKSTDFQEEDTVEKQGLELYVAPDGSTALSLHQLQTKGVKYERVVMGNR